MAKLRQRGVRQIEPENQKSKSFRFIEKLSSVNSVEIISDSIWTHETKWAINRYFKISVNSGMIGEPQVAENSD